MIDLRTYTIIKEDIDADNLAWKVDNWSKQLKDDKKDSFDLLKIAAKSCKDIDSFKDAVSKSNIDFKSLVDVVNDEATGLPDNIDNVYVLKKIIVTINNYEKSN